MTLAKSILGALRPARHGDLPLAPAPRETNFDGGVLDLCMQRLCESMQSFEQWLDEHADCEEYWPAFGECLRSVLHQCCGATRVTPYQISANGRELLALRGGSPLVQTDRISARKGIIGHVFTTGRSFLATSGVHGELVESLARDADASISWCFLVQHQTRRMGVVTAGGVVERNPLVLGLIERLVAQLWLVADQARQIATMQTCDPVCELLARPAFIETAEKAVGEAYHQSAPVAVAVLSLEGVRSMNDSGRWEIADDLLHEVGKFLKAKVRAEDRLGRFDGSRFVLLLRCVDSELATLIVRQLIAQLSTLVGDFGRWGAHVKIRCGLAGSGTGQPTLRDLVTQAMAQTVRARSQNRLVSSDVLEAAPEGVRV